MKVTEEMAELILFALNEIQVALEKVVVDGITVRVENTDHPIAVRADVRNG